MYLLAFVYGSIKHFYGLLLGDTPLILSTVTDYGLTINYEDNDGGEDI